MPYTPPLRTTGPPVKSYSKYGLVVPLPPELRRGMAQHGEIAWAQVCRDAIESVLGKMERKEA